MGDSNTIVDRAYLKSLLLDCNDSQQQIFKRMYSPDNLDLHINEVVDNMPDDQIAWAVKQCERTILSNQKKGIS